MTNGERFGSEQDQNISVAITDENDPFCFTVTFMGGKSKVHLHARSVVDLIHKLNIALMDWTAKEVENIIRGALKK